MAPQVLELQSTTALNKLLESGTAPSLGIHSRIFAAYLHGNLAVLIRPSESGYLAEDTLDFTYGCGSTLAEALADWRVALQERYEVLAESADSLAPYLRKQLEDMKAYLLAGTEHALAA